MSTHFTDRRNVALYCSTEGRAFGPVLESSIEAEEFLEYLVTDLELEPRELEHAELVAHLERFRSTVI